jgi:hypothetical protein
MAYIFIFSIIIPFVLIVVAVPGLRRRSVRGFQTAIELDGAICLKASDGSVAFRPNGGGLLYLGALESVLLLSAGLVGMLNGDGQAGMLPVLIGLIIGCLLVGFAMASIVRSLFRSYLYFDANSRTLETTRPTTQQIPADDGRVEIKRHSRQYYWLAIILLGPVEAGLLALLVILGPELLLREPLFLILPIGIGLALLSAVRSLRMPSIDINANPRTSESRRDQQIPFSEIVNIGVIPRTTGVQEVYIQAVFDRGEAINLGSVSGGNALVRATAISHLVAEVTGAAIRQPIQR